MVAAGDSVTLHHRRGKILAREPRGGESAWESLPKQRETAEKVEIPDAAFGKSLPKQRKSAEKVEIPGAAFGKSLPK